MKFCSKPLMNNYPTNEIFFSHIHEIWNIHSADMIDYKNLNKKVLRYIFVLIDNFSKNTWGIPLKNKVLKQKQTNFHIL